MVTLIGLAMAEVCSSYPTAGGLYYWSAKLARTNSAAWAWFTGWFNLLGQVAVTASIDYGLATFVGFFVKLTFYSGFAAKPWQILLIYALVLASHGALNVFGVRLVAMLSDVSAGGTSPGPSSSSWCSSSRRSTGTSRCRRCSAATTTRPAWAGSPAPASGSSSSG